MKAVILCAGEGTRLRPLTENIPKPLIKVNDKPILSYIFSSLPSQINEIYIIIQERHLEFFEKFLKEDNVKATIFFQNKEKKGNYFALMAAGEYLKNEDKFLVLNGDDIFLKEDLEKLIKMPAPTYGLSIRNMDGRYRTCDLDEENKKILSFRRQKDGEFGQRIPCFTGAYTLSKDFFSYPPVYVGEEAGIPHTLFNSYKNVSYFILKDWVQINTYEDLEQAKNLLK